MSTNPFDDEEAAFHVLVNDQGQYSLWPVFAPVPAGWTVELADVSRTEATDHVEAVWTTLQPAGLRLDRSAP